MIESPQQPLAAQLRDARIFASAEPVATKPGHTLRKHDNSSNDTYKPAALAGAQTYYSASLAGMGRHCSATTTHESEPLLLKRQATALAEI